jgi:hypothetical protein
MVVTPPDALRKLLSSWSEELLSATDRIHHLIGDQHQPTKGSYREVLLRKLLRRVLPDRFRVSTGFIHRFEQVPSRQIDILIWDAQNHSALLEEGELAIITPEAVDAIIEVKSILNAREFRDALKLLHPNWLEQWNYPSASSSTSRRPQHPKIPFRAVFAYKDQRKDAVTSVFNNLASFYRNQFGDDAKQALGHKQSIINNGNSVWLNMLDAICIPDGPYIEQTQVNVDYEDGRPCEDPAFAAYTDQLNGESISVGRFCLKLLKRLTGWDASKVARVTENSLNLTPARVCCFGQFPGTVTRLNIRGVEVNPKILWYPKQPLWTASCAGNRS